MKIMSFCFSAIALLCVAPSAHASVMSDLASATIIEDFQFDDAIGTEYDAAANSANPGNLLSTDSDPTDLAGVSTDGFGNLNASAKSNFDFGTTLVDTVDRSTGRVFGVMELTWDFQSPLDTSENEELRITLISSGSSGVLAEFEIQREDDDTLTILGNTTSGTGTDIPSVVLNGGSLTQTEKFIGVVEVDLDADTYQVHYSADGGTSFTTIGTGNTDDTRDLDKMRIVMNNDLSNDRVLIDRAYLAFIPEPATIGLVGLAIIGLASVRQRV